MTGVQTCALPIYAREIARKEGAELYVHRGDGTIRDRDSYGVNPMPSVAKP